MSIARLLSPTLYITLRCIVITLWLESPISLLALPLNPHCSLYSEAPNIVCLSASSIGPQLRDSPNLWFVEFYSSSCGHCISFAPTYQKLSNQIKSWSAFVKIAVLDCAPSINRETCREFKVHAFPSFKWQPPLSGLIGNKVFIPRRDIPTITNIIIDLIIENRFKYSDQLSRYIQHLDPIRCDCQLETLYEDNSTAYLVMVAEFEGSYVGKQILLDVADHALGRNDIMIRRLEISEGVDCSLLPSPAAQNELPQLLFFKGSSTVLQYKSRLDDVRNHFSAVISHLMTSPRPLTSLSESGLEQGVLEISRNADSEEWGRVGAKSGGKTSGEVVFNRVRHGFTASDLMNAVSYSLRSEVSLKEEIAGDDIPALLAYLELIQHFLPQVHSKAHSVLSPLIDKLSVFRNSPSHVVSHSLTGKHWDLLVSEELDRSVFPVNPRWVGCRGSKPYLRGYTCGIWVLFHVFLTHASLESAGIGDRKFSAVKTAVILRDYVVRFFSCVDCKIHFSRMSKRLEESIHTDRQAVVWFWAAHNKINERLKNDPSVDPTAPKVQFPSQDLCPTCRFTSPISNASPEVFSLYGVTWNTTEVYQFLVHYYNRRKMDGSKSQEIQDNHLLPVCYLVYGLVGVILCMLVRRIYRRHRRIMNRFKQF